MRILYWLIAYFSLSSIAEATTPICSIFPLDPKLAKSLAVGTLVKRWPGKFAFITERNWGGVPSEIQVENVCNNGIEKRIGEKFLLFSKHDRSKSPSVLGDELMPLNSPESTELINTFATKTNFAGELNPSWQFCKFDSDCVHVLNHCEEKVGINKKYLEKFTSNLRKISPSTVCKTDLKKSNIDAPHPQCVDNFCSKPSVKVRTFWGYQY